MSFVDDYLSDRGPDDADITDHDSYVNGVPYATFDRLRADDPVHWTEEADGSGFWSILRYDDVIAVNRDVKTFTSTKGIRLEEMDDEQMKARRTMMEMDPPEHTPYRRLVNRGFTRRTVEAYEGAIRNIVVDVIDAALATEQFDFVKSIAEPLPMLMLGKMLGTSDDDAHKLVAWGDALLGNTDPEFTDFPVDLTDTDVFRTVPFRSPASIEIFQYAESLAADRRTCPRDDVVSRLLEPTQAGEPLSDLEFKNFFTLLVAAGNDTTRYTIAHAAWCLINHPQLWDAWRADPALTASALEEVLRTSSVTMHFRRTATRDVELRGKQIRAGDKVVMWLNAANHDPNRFANPYRYDLRRQKNDHMTFGRNGPHLCIGAWLARMEIRLVLEELMKRVDGLEIAGPIDRLRSNFISGIKRLPVRIR
ncbi:cytochrome P450 [Acidimicrobiaceae bacterium AH-315-P05]|nr:cytochrome P450 [Acidimicrobiaceae bacterium AH-315-P05]